MNNEAPLEKKLKILLFGATGPTGKRLLQQALRAGHQVTAVVRSLEKLDDVKDGNLKLHKGDALNRETFQGCIAETDVVMSCLGSHDLRFSTVSLYSQSIKEIHEVMKSHNKNRIVAMTAWATKDSPLLSWFNRWIFKPVFVAHISADMERMEDYIEKTDLNYTIVRPPGLTNGPSLGRECQVAENEVTVVGASHRMPREDVAAFMLKCLHTDQYDRKMVAIGFVSN